MKRLYLLAAALLILLAALPVVITGCGGSRIDRPTLAVSIAPQKYLLEKIVGSDYNVITLLPPNSDPETYDPSVSTLSGLQKSDIYFRLGTIGFEQAIIGKISENLPELKIVDTSVDIPLASGTHSGPLGTDPHVWTSVRNGGVIASNMQKALVKNYPGKEKELTRRYRQLDAELAELDSTLTAILAPCKGSAFVIRHPSLTYFARDYGLTQLSLEHDGKEPSAKQLADRLEAIKAAKPVVFFLEKGHSNAAMEDLAAQMNIPTVEISLLDYDWKETLLTMARAIASKAAAAPGQGD